ncbi:amino acid ABC transporter permease [Oceanospirillaceae bacterium]|jgi:general L-amino acid transport system permease protein|nr:amino acid ABC transporter permease [Oceanospirillaceae bacterium]MDB9753605.1 amino acid ABC transporter permease [Oceanospirillaceae bacterium]MDB9973198.1 amino acid ABC transporter permease [Oceanospirillaceae bacterium]MDC1340892.1 amino acid ABC transporter permease [Oceanospirillaceae bacterium]
MTMTKQTYVPGTHPSLPPPKGTTGIAYWLKMNLFSSLSNSVITLLAIYLLYLAIPPAINWLFLDATFVGTSRKDCAPDGACLAFIGERFNLFVYGFYPAELRWRVNLTAILLVVASAAVLWDKIPARKYMLWFALAYPLIAAWLLLGGLGLESVSTHLFGGLMLTLTIGVTGIVCSLPLGILLALGRQSNLPIIKYFCIGFIEFIRGVPLITLLFVASTMLSYFLPPGSTFDLLLRVLIMVSLFASAYMAEVIRGGLQALPKGQLEAAESLGLNYGQSMRFIILPQALKVSIPGIVNTFIGLYKDSTLVIVIGLLDPLGIGRASVADSAWLGLSTEVYLFVAIFFFISCFGMSRYSLYLENKLNTGHKR